MDKKNAQDGFGYVSSWLTCIHRMVMIGFKDYDPTWTGRNAAQSYNYYNALLKTDTGFVMNYEAIRFSHGELPGVEQTKVSMIGPETLLIEWSTEIKEGASPSDGLMFIAVSSYPKLQSIALESVFDGKRRDGQRKIRLPEAWQTGTLYVHVAFRSPYTEKNSISQLAGIIDFDSMKEKPAELMENDLSGFCQSTSFSGSLIKRVGVD